MATVKEEILRWAQDLPDDRSWKDLRYFLYVRDRVAEGLKDAEEGPVVPHDEAKRRMAEWLMPYGRNAP